MKGGALVSRVLHYPGSAIRVEGPGDDVAWVVQFLSPSFWSRNQGEADWRVRMVRDEEAFRKRRKAGPDPQRRRRTCFFLDTRTETLPLWRGPRGSTAVFDRAHEAFVFLRDEEREVEVLSPAKSRLPRLSLMRIVREQALSRLMGQQGLLLHASAFAMGGRAALVIGEKRSGKTSLMLHGLSQGATAPVRYLANDRVWLASDNGTFKARGFPTISSLRLSSVDLFPRVKERLRESTWTPVMTLQESRGRKVPQAEPWEGRKYTLSPIQLCRLLEVSASAVAEVGALLFPRVKRAEGRIRMVPMSRADAESALLAGLFRAGTPQKAGGLFAARGFPRRLDAEAALESIRELAGAIPCYAVELGLQAYSDRRWLERLREKMGPGRE